ncbi:adenylate cyclase [Enhydrobacter aerosaccus]|uniref:Adenylate cyclase n=1 Tax=Enhydrobacter aerosaccus TaxID=225324 RepID=A0A1T4SBA1_9HYPH|nr:adenylate/guanylate cyclase domain-containing protein [Enhydrobacter aerosaccus]SKA25131.1 adenylate cyclase [Enhydrobacter aerosaccus]
MAEQKTSVSQPREAPRRVPLPAGLVTIADHTSLPPPADGLSLSDWLIEKASRRTQLYEVIDELCWRLIDAGVPIWRSTLHLATLHPQLRAYAVRWWHDAGLVEELSVLHGMEETGAYRNSPVPLVMERGEIVHRRLGDAEALEFPVLAELRARGGTDYIAMPVTFSNGRHQCLTFATDRADGFTDTHVARLTELSRLLALVLELHATKRMARDLLGIYLGREAGSRVLDGAIRRGMTERIEAAILVADMRGFSALSRTLGGEQTITLLDEFFAAVVEPIQARGGEVLKFVGDGLIAVFPLATSRNLEVAVHHGLDAARAALVAIDRLNAERAKAGLSSIGIGIALHVGEVLFGNVGAPDRLDFTAIGSALNFTTHLEALNKSLGSRLVASREFAIHCAEELTSFGSHVLPDSLDSFEVFGLRGRSK